MKKLILALFIVLYSPHLIVHIPHMITYIGFENSFTIIKILMFISFVFACVNIVYAILWYKNIRTDAKKRQMTNRMILAAKWIAIPWFVLNLLFWMGLSGLMMIVTRGLGIFALVIVIPLSVGYTFVILLATSSYSLSLLFALYMNKEITRKQFILHSIFQLLFVVDVIDQIVIQRFTKVKVAAATDADR